MEGGGQHWRVTGGSSTGGLLVREGKKLTSAALEERLATGALVEQLALDGDRLQFRTLQGEGPVTGWISIKMKGHDIVVRETSCPLRKAIEEEDEATALEILANPDAVKQANTVGPEPTEFTTLHEAAMHGLYKVCSGLLGAPQLARMRDPDALDSLFKSTALHGAAAFGRVKVCELLLDHPRFTATDVQNVSGETALHVAADKGHAEICQLLLGHKKFSAQEVLDTQGQNAMHTACWRGHLAIAKVLLEAQGFAGINAHSGEGSCQQTMLIIASLTDNVEMAKLLLASPRYTMVNEANGNGCTALGSAAWGRSPDIVQLLLDTPRFTAVNAQTKSGWVPIHEAVIQRGVTLPLLLDHPRFHSHNTQSFEGNTALHDAAARGHADECQQLLDCPKFTAADALNGEGRTALHLAAVGGHAAACAVLLGHTKFTAVDLVLAREGITALHLAAWAGSGEACKTLLDSQRFGAAGQQSLDGSTALHVAAQQDRPEACRALIQHARFGGQGLATVENRRGKAAFNVAKPLSEAWQVLEELLTGDDDEG